MGKRLEHILNQRGDMDGRKQMKRNEMKANVQHYQSLKEIQIIPMMRYHHISITMARIKNTGNIKC